MKNKALLKLIWVSILSSLFIFQSNFGYSKEYWSDNLLINPSFEDFPDSALSPAANAIQQIAVNRI